MHIIVDGYNYLLRGQSRGILAEAELERLREGVIQKHGGYAAARNIRITLVFDGVSGMGAQTGGRTGKIRVVYSNPPENADARIKRIVQAAEQPRDILVVTSDQPLARFVQSCGCRLLSSEAWRQKMEHGRDQDLQEKHGRVDDLNLDEWLRIFGEK